MEKEVLDKILEISKLYKAKSTGDITVYTHSMDLEKVRKNIIDVFDINSKLAKNIEETNILHDIGKIVVSFKDNIETTKRTVRHEILSASIEGIEDNIRIAILTSHRSLEKVRGNIERKEYLEELKEMEEKLLIKFKDIKEFIDYCSTGKGEALVKDLETILLKGYLNYCDHLASAKIFNLDKGLDTIKDFKIPGERNSIQNKVLDLNLGEDVIIIGATGSGKTAAAMFWSNLMQNKEKSKRIEYILPYTGSINAKFIEMSEMQLSVAMIHSKAEYFLENYDMEKNYNEFKKSIKQINITTIFQLVKAIFSCKWFEMLLSQMKNNIFIVDEIHTFDIKELSYILELLKWLKENLGIKVCIMSASIPTSLLEVIKSRLKIERVILQNMEEYKIRHQIKRKGKKILDDLESIEREIKKGKKVLICVNSVNLAQSLYKYLKAKFPELKENQKLKIVHGRFASRDRNKQEKGIEDGLVLIGTQAIEVSLNIDYDILFTELAPLDALIQRFGRVNRFGKKEIGIIYVYNGENKIYKKEILERTDSVIEEILKNDKGFIREEKLQYYLDKVYPKFNYEEYNKYKYLIKEMISELKVGTYSKLAKEIVNRDMITVIPRKLYKEYLSLIEEHKFLEAESLKVTIRKFPEKDKFEYDKKNKIYVVNYKYDSEIGLEFEEVKT